MEYCIWLWAHQYKREIKLPDTVQHRPLWWGSDWSISVCYKEELRLLPGDRKAQGDLTNVYKYCTREGVRDRPRVFSAVPSDKTRGNRHKLKQEVPSEHQKTVFHWHRLPREAVASHSLGIKTHVDSVLSNLLYMALLVLWTRQPPEDSDYLNLHTKWLCEEIRCESR